MIAEAVRNWMNRLNRGKLVREAEKAAKVLDIMLADSEWYGGVTVVTAAHRPSIEVLIVDTFPPKLSTFIPPHMGAIPVLVRFGSILKSG